MNDARPAGDAGRLEVYIRRKSFLNSEGETRDVLADVAFELKAGQVAALAGPSGSGKTTILKIIAGLDRDFDGHVAFPGWRVGFVFQEPRLLPWRNVEDNVRLAAPRAGTAELDELFNALDLGEHRRHYPSELSLGLARRVAIARALAVRPDLLLLDEPFVSLDEQLARQLQDEVMALVARRSVTTLLVSHDLTEAARLAERLILLDQRPARIAADIALAGPWTERPEARIAFMVEQIRLARTEASRRPSPDLQASQRNENP